MPNEKRLKIFVGSSGKSKTSTLQLKSWLEAAKAKAELWSDQQTLRNKTPTAQDFLKLANSFDGAAFVLSEDEKYAPDGSPLFQTLDNVHIEFGLFLSVLSPNWTIACRKSPSRPRYLSEITLIDLNQRGKAKTDIAEWMRALRKSKNSKSHAKTEGAAVESAVRVLADRTDAVAGKNIRTARDSLSAMVASNTYDALDQELTDAHIYYSRTKVDIAANGDVKVNFKITFEGRARPLFSYPLELSGDVAASIDELRLRISGDSSGRCWLTISQDNPNLKKLLIIFKPPVKPGSRRDLYFSWTWPKAFKKLTLGQVDYWDHMLASASEIPIVELTFNVDKSILPLAMTKVGNVPQGTFVQKPPRINRKTGNRIYHWTIRDFPGGDFSFRMKPLSKRML